MEGRESEPRRAFCIRRFELSVMIQEAAKKDLLLLVPDKNTQFALRGALPRSQSLGIRPITFDFLVHSGRDGGVRATGAALGALKRNQFRHLLMIFDHEGSGAEGTSAAKLTAELEKQLDDRWTGDARVIVIEPEVDIWLWGSDNVLSQLLKWRASDNIRDWLKNRGFEFDGNDKPVRPKEAFEALRDVHGMPRSSSLYEKIATQLSLPRCLDPAFVRLRKILQLWFPPTGP